MKNLFYSILLLAGAALSLQSCKPAIEKQDQFISLEVENIRASKNISDSIVRVSYMQGTDFKLDTLAYVNGKFIFNKSVDIPEGSDFLEFRIYFPNDELIKWVGEDRRSYYPSSAGYMKIYAYKGLDLSAKVNINNEEGFVSYEVVEESNRSINKDLSELNKTLNPAINASVNQSVLIYNTYNLRDSLVRVSQEYLDAQAKADELSKATTDMMVDYIKANTNKEAGALVLSNIMRNMEVNELETAYYNNFSEEVKNSSYGLTVKNHIDALRSTEVGAIAMDVVGKTYKGEDFKMSDLRGSKVVILDFWGTWCGPCKDGMPHMLEAYKKYEGKLEIVGLANDKRAQWENFLSTSEFQWVHILDEDVKFVKQFAVTAFPTKYVIGLNGEILYKEVGENSGFYAKLDEIMAGIN